MTKIIEINCDTARKILLYTVWSLVSIGLIFGLHDGYNMTFNGFVWDQDDCNNAKLSKNQQAIEWRCIKVKDPTIFWAFLVLTFFNMGTIWYTIHIKIRLIEFRCKNKELSKD